LQVPLLSETVPPEPIDKDLVQVLVTLVERCGMRNMLLSLAGIAYAKSIQILADEPGISDEWKAVADGLERVARTRLKGLGAPHR
jgi:hypothetical protein